MTERAFRSDRAQIDDAAPAAAAHVRQGRSAHEDDAHQVRGKNILPVVQRTFGERAPAEIADVVDQHIEPAEAIGDGLQELFGADRARDVGFDGDAIRSSGLQLAQRTLCRGFIGTIADGDARAILR